MKEQWGIRRWAELDAKLGDLIRATLEAVRYTEPSDDSNRSRWPNHRIWDAVIRETSADLSEMMSSATPVRVKEVRRDHLIEILLGQIVGTAATLAVATRMTAEELEGLPESIARAVDQFISGHPEQFDDKMSRAEQRYRFVS